LYGPKKGPKENVQEMKFADFGALTNGGEASTVGRAAEGMCGHTGECLTDIAKNKGRKLFRQRFKSQKRKGENLAHVGGVTRNRFAE